MFKTTLLCVFVLLLIGVYAHPTVYKLNDNLKLEPDLVAVSSTVIPLPIYQVGYGIGVAKGPKESKTTLQKPEGPVTLVTAYSKKKTMSEEKVKKMKDT